MLLFSSELECHPGLFLTTFGNFGGDKDHIFDFRVTCNFGDYIKLMPDIVEIPCSGDNGIYVQEKGGVAGPFCGKKMMPAFVSKDVTVDIYINIEVPAVSALNETPLKKNRNAP